MACVSHLVVSRGQHEPGTGPGLSDNGTTCLGSSVVSAAQGLCSERTVPLPYRGDVASGLTDSLAAFYNLRARCGNPG